MKTIQSINIIVSFIIMVTSLYILFKHYTREESRLELYLQKWQYVFFKIALTFMSMGTLWNLFKKEPTPESEILLNVGLAMFMVFLAMLFNKLFCCDKKSIDPTDDPVPDDTEG